MTEAMLPRSHLKVVLASDIIFAAQRAGQTADLTDPRHTELLLHQPCLLDHSPEARIDHKQRLITEVSQSQCNDSDPCVGIQLHRVNITNDES